MLRADLFLMLRADLFFSSKEHAIVDFALGQAKDWEYRALAELETYFRGSAQRTVAQLEIGIAA